MAEALARSPVPLTLPALEAHFKGRGPWKKGLPTLLQTLETLGRAQAVQAEGGMPGGVDAAVAGVVPVRSKAMVAVPRPIRPELATMAP